MVPKPLQLLLWASTITAVPMQLRIITFNIRYASTSPFTGERPWRDRAPLVINQLKHETWSIDALSNASAAGTPAPATAFICLQEVLHNQLVDVLSGLNGLPSTGSDPPSGPIWAHIGVGRDDGKRAGEYSPIIYPTNIFSVLHWETVWLSPTPDKPSLGWDAGSIRIVTVGVFENKGTKQRIIAASTHLDNVSSKSRFESVGIILKTLKRFEADWGEGGKTPIFLGGDFNSFTTQEAYKAMKESGYMKDLFDLVDPKARNGNINTFTGFQPDKDKDLQGRIDYIWLGPYGAGVEENHWKADGYAALPNVLDAGVYLSDHRAVGGDTRLV